MASQYYLMSQLPAIDSSDTKALPITEQYFRELCSRFLDKKNLAILENLSLEPPRQESSTGSEFLDRWNERERCLRLALASIRAVKMKRDAGVLPGSCTADIVQAARTAVGMSSPLEAEEFLNQYRMQALNAMQPLDNFSTDAVFAYALKLLLCQRMRLFDKENGKVSYRKIYDEILGEAT